MAQRTFSKLVSKQPYRIILGIASGFVFEAILVTVLSGNFSPSWLGNTIVLIVSYGGFGLIIFGYLYKKNGEKPFSSDFILGMGIGIILVWFIGAGSGS